MYYSERKKKQPQDIPMNFCRWLYRYCATHSDITHCRIALVKVQRLGYKNYTWQLPIVLSSSLTHPLTEHHQKIYAMAQKLLPVGKEATCLAKLDDCSCNIGQELLNVPPFYSAQDPQGWLAKIRRRFNHPIPVLVELELTD